MLLRKQNNEEKINIKNNLKKEKNNKINKLNLEKNDIVETYKIKKDENNKKINLKKYIFILLFIFIINILIYFINKNIYKK